MDNDAKPHRFTDIRWVESTGSTNADVLAHGRDGAPEGVVIVAATQTAGRGRHDRTWVAPPGSGLLFSVLLRPRAGAAGLITAAAALALQDAVVALGATGVGIKWPNDLVVAVESEPTGGTGERKLAGILAEADWTRGTTPSGGYRPAAATERLLVALGVGLNLATSAAFPPEVLERRVALEELIGVAVDRGELLEKTLEKLDRWYDLLTSDPGEVLDAWRYRCVTVGRRVRVDLGASDLVGTAVDLDTSGRLVVSTDPGGQRRVVAAGDVVHLRDETGT